MSHRLNLNGAATAADSASSFASLVIKHDQQHEALEHLKFLLNHGVGYELICLVGPTGVGKSTLAARLMKDLLQAEQPRMMSDREFVPFISTTAVASGFRAFDWKVLYHDALLALGDPFVDDRRPTPEAREQQHKRVGESLTAATLRLRLSREMKRRRLKYWFIDEAQHILMGARAGGIGDQYDVLKSVAQSCGVKLVLVGTYQLLVHLQVSAQLARRTEVVHFGRYRHGEADDRNAFASCVQTFLARSGAEVFPNVEAEFDFFYAGSVGCIGILKDWCARAMSRARMEVRSRLTIEDFRRTRLSGRAITRIVKDIHDGEDLASPDTDRRIEAMVLGAPASGSSSTTPKEGSGKGGRPGKVGVRSPTRDSVPPVAGGLSGGAHA